MPILRAIPGIVRAFIEEVHAFIEEVLAWKRRIDIMSVIVCLKFSTKRGWSSRQGHFSPSLSQNRA